MSSTRAAVDVSRAPWENAHMSETRQLYYEDQYLKAFTARIVEKRPRKKGGFEIILDQTCFYPEGGGQPADIGTLGDVSVVDVRKGENGEILHITDGDPGAGELSASLDWEHRYEYMQQHTGQHVLSGALFRHGLETVSVHQGSDFTTIEVNAPEVPEEKLRRIEAEANQVIRENRVVRDFEVEEDEVDRYELRRPPKVSGRIRLVEIDGFDLVACGGVHLSGTGEVGVVHAVRTEKIRGNSRIYWKIGRRAYKDYREKTEITNALMDRLSAKPPEIVDRVAKLEESAKTEEYKRHQLETGFAELYLQRSLASDPSALPIIVDTLSPGNEASLLQRIVQRASEEEAIALLLFLEDPAGGYRWSLTIRGTREFPQKALKEELLPAMEAKGGGKPPLWQGKAEAENAPALGEQIFKAIVTAEA